MENQGKPRREWKAFLLLPLLALGVGILIVTRKPLPSEKPKLMTPQMRKAEAYRHAAELVMNQLMESQPGWITAITVGPYQGSSVTPLAQDHYRCSNFLLERSHTGATWREHWQCIVWTRQGYWMCQELKETRRTQIAAGRLGRGPAGMRNVPP